MHLHFITEGRDAGGHVLSLTVDRGTLMADETTRLTLALPETEAFRGAQLAVDEDELEVAETEGVSGILPPPMNRQTVEHYVSKEWAVHLEDVMLRRAGWHYFYADASERA